MRLRRLGLMCVASVVITLLLPANAFAAFRLRVEDAAGSGVVITDGANGDLERSLGLILVGDHELSSGITIGYTVAETKPAVPSRASSIYSQLFLSSNVMTTTRAARVSLFIEEALPATAEPLPPAGTTPTPLQTFVSSGKDLEIFGGESYTWFSDVGPAPGYSLSSAITIDFLGAGQVDFTHAPEPSALALFGAGLLGIVHIARRRRRGMPRHDV